MAVRMLYTIPKNVALPQCTFTANFIVCAVALRKGAQPYSSAAGYVIYHSSHA
jgi:hypothetical protein